MNLLEHYIKKVHSITDVTDKAKKYVFYRVGDKYVKVNMDIVCYGIEENVTKIMINL